MNNKEHGHLSDIAIAKSSLTTSELNSMLHTESLRVGIRRNIESAKHAPYVQEQKGIFSYEDYSDRFSLTGALRVKDINQLGSVVQTYLTGREGRLFTSTGNDGQPIGYLLRGPRYITAVDPNLSVPQKLDIYKQDYEEGITALSSVDELPSKQHYEISPILDYAKNAVVTIFNAYIQSEKVGEYQLDNPTYKQNRSNLIAHMRKLIASYHLSLVDSLTEEQLENTFLPENQETVTSVIDILRSDFKDYTFSSSFLVRQEASHPLVNLASAYVVTQEHPESDTVVGFPSGATELACTVAETYKQVNHNDVDLILLPFSLHSVKKQFAGSYKKTDMTDFILHHEDKLRGKKIIAVDDNSSTGKTIQSVVDVLRERVEPQDIIFTVAEADIVRSQVDKDDSKRAYIAHPDLYGMAVNILPVSRAFKPKHDLREILENRELAEYYSSKAKEAETLQERIKYEVYADGLLYPAETLWETTNKDQRIDNFHHTFLSNFYAAPVEFEGQIFPSVEHAYQRAKFGLEDLASLTLKQQRQIKTLLHQRHEEQKQDLSTIFIDEKSLPGSIKLVANKLREFGLARKDWDEKRVDTMIDLVIQKFQHPELAEQLLQTENKTLIEVNDWNDTFWGVSNGRGRNMLGRILMNVRSKLNSGEIQTELS